MTHELSGLICFGEILRIPDGEFEGARPLVNRSICAHHYFQTEIDMLAPPSMRVSPCSQTLPHDHEGRAE